MKYEVNAPNELVAPAIEGLEVVSNGEIASIPNSEWERVALFARTESGLSPWPALAFKHRALTGRAIVATIRNPEGKTEIVGYQSRVKICDDSTRMQLAMIFGVHADYFKVPDYSRNVLCPIDIEEEASAMTLDPELRGKGLNTYLKRMLDDLIDNREDAYRTNPKLRVGGSWNLAGLAVNIRKRGMKMVDTREFPLLAQFVWFLPYPKGQGNKALNERPLEWANQEELAEIQKQIDLAERFPPNRLARKPVFMVSNIEIASQIEGMLRSAIERVSIDKVMELKNFTDMVGYDIRIHFQNFGFEPPLIDKLLVLIGGLKKLTQSERDWNQPEIRQ